MFASKHKNTNIWDFSKICPQNMFWFRRHELYVWNISFQGNAWYILYTWRVGLTYQYKSISKLIGTLLWDWFNDVTKLSCCSPVAWRPLASVTNYVDDEVAKDFVWTLSLLFLRLSIAIYQQNNFFWSAGDYPNCACAKRCSCFQHATDTFSKKGTLQRTFFPRISFFLHLDEK